MSELRFILRKVATADERELSGVMPVGREVVGGIKLVEEGASRRHATLSVEDGVAYVEDADSRNGTFVNDSAVTAKTALKSGDRLRFHKEAFDFYILTSQSTVAGIREPQKKAAPGAWVDWNDKGSDGTERFTPAQLAEYLRKAKERQGKRPQIDCSEPCLYVSMGGAQGRTIPLTDTGAASQEWTIGRGPECTIRLDEGDISEWHAKIVREGQKWKLIDAISSNGSFVNDLQVGMSYLASGDCLRFGRVECTFLLPNARRGRPPTAGLAGASGAKRPSAKTVVAVAVTASFLVTMIILYFLFRNRTF
jgi:pSer/pThr/pTyr-binding forkhead associated (FHA) protein